MDKLKIAIVCDWLTVYAGAERVIYEMHSLFPDAPIFTTIYDKKKCGQFKDADVRESGLRYIPFASKLHRFLFPFMPGIFERLDLDGYDIVLSSSHSASKGVITKPETLHISYCHSPMRYVWDHSHSYRSGFWILRIFKLLFTWFFNKVRIWDKVAADRVDVYISNSEYIKKRIKKYYGRESHVIYPPVDLGSFDCSNFSDEIENSDGEEYYLAVGRLIPYKRFDLVVEAFKKSGKNLKIVGLGPEFKRLKRRAGENIQFLGKISDEDLKRVYSGAKALVFPQLEDFGIVPLEAMACGTPVIAYGAGGALETVKEDVSGIFFKEQSVEDILKACKKFEKFKTDPVKISESVEEFSSARFRSELGHFISEAWKQHKKF